MMEMQIKHNLYIGESFDAIYARSVSIENIERNILLTESRKRN